MNVGWCRSYHPWMLLSFSYDLVTEDDPHFAIGSVTGDGLETGLLRGIRLHATDVALEASHEEEDAHDHEWPRDQDRQQEHLVRREEVHAEECRR